MHPLVRDLYKRVIFVGRDYPLGLPWVQEKAKSWIRQNKDVTDEKKIRKLVHEGRFYVKEMQNVIQLKKYRTLKRRYDTEQTDFEQIIKGLETKAKEKNL
eukprot:snap_masked-scaffold_1-processed-gene-18.16-mRNA-1 protein AED:0.44 eAED:0.44 QI:0/-1/0/1/-1/1/1/0/99